MQAAGTATDEGIFKSITRLEKAGGQPWASILISLAIYCASYWRIEIAPALGCAFALRMLTEAWRAAGSFPAAPKGLLSSYGKLQPPSRWIFAPILGSVGVVALLALLPWRIQFIFGVSTVMAIWITADAFSGFSLASSPAEPPFRNFSLLTRRKSRPGGFLLSASAHAFLCFLPFALVIMAAWLTPQEPVLKKPAVKDVLILRLRPPEPVKQQKKVVAPRESLSARLSPPDEQPKTIDVGKLDLSKMAVEFAPDRDQALASVLADYGARIALVNGDDTEDFLKGRTPAFLSDFVFSAVDWSRIGREGIPQDISTEYLLHLEDPEKCLAIAHLLAGVGAARGKLEVWLVFPRIVKGFEEQLDLAIRQQAQKQAAELHGSIISKVLLAFSAQAPGIAVMHVDAVAGAPVGN